MPVVPPNNLPPESQPWARDRDAAIAQLQLDALKAEQSNANAFTGINNSLTAIGKQLEAVSAASAAAAAASAAALSAANTANAAVADLAARVSVTASIGNFNTGTLPNDASDHFYGAAMPITIAVPTGKVLVTVGCGQATIAAGTGAVIAEATFTIPGYVNYYDHYARFYNADSVYLAGGSMVVTRSFNIPPGTYTITGQMSAWASGTGGSVNFSQPYITVQVTG